MSDFFRIIRGLQLDDAVSIIQGNGAPGLSVDTIAANVGSLYLDTSAGSAYTKTQLGGGLDRWASTNSVRLLSEQPTGAYTPPSAQGNNSLAIGSGAQTTATAHNAIALGEQSLARIPNSIISAAGRFATTGDAQVGRYVLRTITTNNIETEAFIDGPNGSIRLEMPDDSTWTFTATVTAHRTDASDGHAGYKIEGVVYRAAGANTIAFQGAPVKTVLAESNTPWDINITADATTGSLRLIAQGQTGKTIRWMALIDTVEITN